MKLNMAYFVDQPVYRTKVIDKLDKQKNILKIRQTNKYTYRKTCRQESMNYTNVIYSQKQKKFLHFVYFM